MRIAELPEVARAVTEARDLVDMLIGQRVLRRRGSDVSMEAALRGARASAVLEGADAALEQVRSGESDDPRVKGALRVSGELGLLVETWSKAPRQVLARLHMLAAADAVAAEDLGRPRREGESATDPLGLGAPPNSAEVAVRLEALAALLAARTDAPALVVSAVVHGELLALRPFGWGDGIVARAAERLTLLERGLDPNSLVPTQLGHEQRREEYVSALRGYLTGTPEGVGGWVAHCARAVMDGARDSLATCEAIRRASSRS
ncbi:oxidoreductase [Thermobifida halotolerans]|uniref:Oxidoreductase n=1 Tax=Thermobifida halotolerans TaxID=483545 RepID=A0AA97M2K0_9ACTN|nr:oxidoreductase [Thermobifida halotolerans]UOE22170.1 oxidoreductase [Thermobifida halotolerans]